LVASTVKAKVWSLECFRPWVSAIALACASASLCEAAETTPDRHAQMTAAYVFNFVKFVEWPPGEFADELVVCFVGAPEVRAALAASVGNKQATMSAARTKNLVARDVPAGTSLEECQVIFLSGTKAVIPKHRAALTIGESDDFTLRGGIIRLYTESNRLRFIINVDNAKREGIQVSSNLLKLATHVEQGGAR
jgi:hypothetical protein